MAYLLPLHFTYHVKCLGIFVIPVAVGDAVDDAETTTITDQPERVVKVKKTDPVNVITDKVDEQVKKALAGLVFVCVFYGVTFFFVFWVLVICVIFVFFYSFVIRLQSLSPYSLSLRLRILLIMFLLIFYFSV